jgi:hypothetical protein
MAAISTRQNASSYHRSLGVLSLEVIEFKYSKLVTHYTKYVARSLDLEPLQVVR